MKLSKVIIALVIGAGFLFASSSFTAAPETETNLTEVSQNELGTVKKFLAMLDGTEKTAEAAVKKFGSKDVISNGMIPFGDNPSIVSQEGNCCIVQLDYDGDTNKYDICEENGKISSFKMHF
jgi:hypothetical protein